MISDAHYFPNDSGLWRLKEIFLRLGFILPLELQEVILFMALLFIYLFILEGEADYVTRSKSS